MVSEGIRGHARQALASMVVLLSGLPPRVAGNVAMEHASDRAISTVIGRAGVDLALSEGLLYQLPADGSWVQFDVEYTFKMAGQEQSGRQTMTMASVGTVNEGSEESRWIEFKMLESGSDRFWTRKLLIPVRYLKRGENPTEHVIRGWTLQENRAVEPAVAVHGRWPAYLAGRLQDEKTLPKQLVETKLGALMSDGVTGWIEFSEGKLHTKVTYETRIHPKAPFGVLASRTLFECSGEGDPYTIDGRMKLTDFGTGARTSLPDHR